MADAPKYDFSGLDEIKQKYDFSGLPPMPESVAKPDSEYSTTSATALGAAKGVTMGFDDEIAGVAMGLINKGIGDKKDFWDIYKDIRDKVRTAHSQAEEQHPVASFAGELAGGVVPLAFAPEALVGKGAVEGAGFLARAKAMAATGAKVGAIAGLGGSNADLTQGDVAGAAKDVATGAATGGILGAASEAVGHTVGKVASKANEYAKQFPIYNEVQRTFGKAAEGNSLMGKATETTQMVNNGAQSLVNTLERLRAETGAARAEAMQDATKTGITIPSDEWADTALAKAEAMLPGANDADKASINTFIKQVKLAVGEKTEDVTSWIPNEPKLTADQKAVEANRSTMATKAIGDNEMAAQINKSIKDDLKSGKLNPDTEEGAAELVSRYNRAKAFAENNTWSPEVQKDADTGVEAIVNARGTAKAPVVSNIKQNPFDANASKVIGEATSRGVESLTPAQVDKIASDLNYQYRALKPEQGQVRTLYGDTKTDLQQRMFNSSKISPEIKEDAIADFNKAIEEYKGETGEFGTVAGTQELLGQPGYSSTSGDNSGNATRKLQVMIQNYNKPGSQARMILDQSMDKLSQSFPEAVPMIRRMIQDTSANRDIALGLANQSPLATNLLHASAKAVTMNLADLGGKAYGGILKMGGGAAQNISKSMTDIGKHIYDFSPEQTQSLANFVINKGGTYASTLGKPLQEAVNASQGKRRALLFALMQQPDFRNVAGQFMSNNEESP
jgi:hypothetical protein